MASQRPSLPQFFVPGANDPETAWSDMRSRTSGTMMVWLDPRQSTHWANPFMVGASDIQYTIEFAASYALLDSSTSHQLGTYPRLDDALEGFRATVPASESHSLQLRQSNGSEQLIAESLGLSLLAYGPDPAVLWNLAAVLKHEVGLEDAMRWVMQVVSEPRSSLNANAVRTRWKRHQESFRTLVERFVREPSWADAALFAEIQPLHRERDEILDLARRLQRDPKAVESPSVADLRTELLRVQRELRTR